MTDIRDLPVACCLGYKRLVAPECSGGESGILSIRSPRLALGEYGVFKRQSSVIYSLHHLYLSKVCCTSYKSFLFLELETCYCTSSYRYFRHALASFKAFYSSATQVQNSHDPTRPVSSGYQAISTLTASKSISKAPGHHSSSIKPQYLIQKVQSTKVSRRLLLGQLLSSVISRNSPLLSHRSPPFSRNSRDTSSPTPFITRHLLYLDPPNPPVTCRLTHLPLKHHQLQNVLPTHILTLTLALALSNPRPHKSNHSRPTSKPLLRVLLQSRRVRQPRLLWVVRGHGLSMTIPYPFLHRSSHAGEEPQSMGWLHEK